jgi:hypothetical protein
MASTLGVCLPDARRMSHRSWLSGLGMSGENATACSPRTTSPERIISSTLKMTLDLPTPMYPDTTARYRPLAFPSSTGLPAPTTAL